MGTVSSYLNFDGQTEAAFEHYAAVFGAKPVGPVVRIGDIPTPPGATRTEAQSRRIAHMAIAIMGGHVLRGTDVPGLAPGSQMGLMLEPDDRTPAYIITLEISDERVVGIRDFPDGAAFTASLRCPE